MHSAIAAKAKNAAPIAQQHIANRIRLRLSSRKFCILPEKNRIISARSISTKKTSALLVRESSNGSLMNIDRRLPINSRKASQRLCHEIFFLREGLLVFGFFFMLAYEFGF